MELPRSEDEILLLHNPKCSKSRETLALLEQRGGGFGIRRYLDEPLSLAELRELAARLGKRPIEFIRTKQPEFDAAGLTTRSSDDELLAGIEAQPILLERPIVLRGGRAAIGRPPEAVLALLD